MHLGDLALLRTHILLLFLYCDFPVAASRDLQVVCARWEPGWVCLVGVRLPVANEVHIGVPTFFPLKIPAKA
jgi:hypothetical protein